MDRYSILMLAHRVEPDRHAQGESKTEKALSGFHSAPFLADRFELQTEACSACTTKLQSPQPQYPSWSYLAAA